MHMLHSVPEDFLAQVLIPTENDSSEGENHHGQQRDDDERRERHPQVRLPVREVSLRHAVLPHTHGSMGRQL